MSQWTRGANPIWWLPDLTGVSLNDQYYAFFLTNDLPYIPQSVFQDPNGISPWANPLQFSPAGTLPNNLYFDDTLTYRIEIRMGNTQNDPLIWLIENYQVSGSGSGPTSDTLITAENLITNPQFADIYFQSPLTYANASPGTYTISIGPGWSLVLTGAGTTTVTQSNTSGNQEIPGNPSYYLEVNSSGWTSVQVIQKFSNNGAIFNLGAIGVAFSAFANSSAQVVTVSYSPSTGSPTTILASSVSTGSFQQFGGAINLPSSTNSDEAEAAFVNIIFSLPGTSDVALSNIQITGQESSLINTAIVPVYQELTYERMVDHEFNVYKNPIIAQSKESYTIGWDFGFNPCQELGKTVTPIATGANGSTYIADQTIVFQTVDSAIGATFNNYGVTLTTAHNTSFSLVQYLDAPTAVKLLNQRNSMAIKGRLSTGAGTLVGTPRLYWTTNGSLPDITSPSFDSLVTSITAGIPAVVGGWTLIPRDSYGDASFTLTTSDQVFNLSQWDATQVSSIDTATFFAVVITFDTMATTQAVNLEYISLCEGDFASRSAILSASQTLQALERYYEKSYDAAVLPGSGSFPGAIVAPMHTQVSGNASAYAQAFTVKFRTTKRTISNVIVYDPNAGTAGNVQVIIDVDNTLNGNSVAITPSWDSTGSKGENGNYVKSASVTALNTVAAGTVNFSWIDYHYTSDARFGVV